MGFFENLANGLRRTRENIAYGLSGKKLSDEFYDGLEESLILADAGADTAVTIVEELRAAVKERHILEAEEAITALKEIVIRHVEAPCELELAGQPAVILLIGVNGAGKTTTAGKLANLFRKQGKSVLLAAADTFRAAAADQLKVWAERADVPLIEGASDPSAVIYDAVASARAKGIELVIADTAGRLQTKKNLMDELAKMARTIHKASPEAKVETLLVIEAATGQNALSQAAQFADSAGVNGIVLTKLDGTAKGGVVIAIKDRLGIPVRFVGVGEQIDDLDRFVPSEFAGALFG